MPQSTTADHVTALADEIFARRLRELRQGAGLTQQQLAGRMGAAGARMHRSAIAKIESGDRVVPVGEAVQLAEVLGVPLAEMVTEPADRARTEALVRLRAAEHHAAQRHDLLEEAQLLYAHSLEAAEEARQQLAALDEEG